MSGQMMIRSLYFMRYFTKSTVKPFDLPVWIKVQYASFSKSTVKPLDLSIGSVK